MNWQSKVISGVVAAIGFWIASRVFRRPVIVVDPVARMRESGF